mgnify:CR=1 FL=1
MFWRDPNRTRKRRWPWATRWPTFSLPQADMWPYTVLRPWPWSIITTRPKPFFQPTKVTLPSPAAMIGVPVRAA